MGDLPTYIAFAREAQEYIRGRGLAQWVPAAHAGYAPELARKLADGNVRRVARSSEPIAFFVLSDDGAPWWERAQERALYLSGIVVSRAARGERVGQRIIAWCRDRAIEGRYDALRLDCHAENGWLCRYYTNAGFIERRRVEQHPGYVGALFELDVLQTPSQRGV